MRTSSRRLRNQITLLVVNIAVQVLATQASLLRFGVGVPAEVGTRPPESVDWQRNSGTLPSGVPTRSSFASGTMPGRPEIGPQPVRPVVPSWGTWRPNHPGGLN
jgi:hypothetical protein